MVSADPATPLALESLLTGKGRARMCGMVKVRSDEEALRRALDEDFVVILLDIDMPSVAERFETSEAITPITFTTASYKDLLQRRRPSPQGNE